MIIREANIGKFGKLENQKYQFAPQINVIYGANESGKSTLMQFLKAMLFGLEKTRRWILITGMNHGILRPIFTVP